MFHGFLPRKPWPKTRLLESLCDEPRTLIFFETPHRLRHTLKVLRETLGTRRMILARELTKMHEEIIRGTVEEVIEVAEVSALKGELTLVIEGKSTKKQDED